MQEYVLEEKQHVEAWNFICIHMQKVALLCWVQKDYIRHQAVGGEVTELGWVQEPEVEFHHTGGSGVGLPRQHPRVTVGGHLVA
jgi:hypothetical protein